MVQIPPGAITTSAGLRRTSSGFPEPAFAVVHSCGPRSLPKASDPHSIADLSALPSAYASAPPGVTDRSVARGRWTESRSNLWIGQFDSRAGSSRPLGTLGFAPEGNGYASAEDPRYVEPRSPPKPGEATPAWPRGMDAHDVRIFCALGVSGPPDAIAGSRPPGIGRVARSLGLDEKTVRVRLRRLEREGFIKYYQATPDLALLGMRAEVTCRFDAVNVATKLGALAFAKDIEGMVEGLDYLGTSFFVTVAGPSFEAAAVAQRSLAHRFELDRIELGRRTLDPSSATLVPLDWRIIHRMRYDARAPPSDVAAALGVTPRMVRYRLGRIRATDAVTIRPMIDARRLHGLLVYRLVVTPGRNTGDELVLLLRRRLGRTIWAVRRSLAGPILLDMFGSGLADPEESVVRALEVTGVEACHTLVLKQVLEPGPGSWIDRAVAELGRN